MELPTRHRFDIDTFFRMADVGIIEERERIELLDGTLIDMAPIGQDHAGMVNVLTETLVLACAGRAIVAVQNPLRLSPHDMPQPDAVIYRRRDDYYRGGEHAGPADVFLVIEVSDSTLRFDRTTKLELYATAGIPEYWIVDLNDRALIVHRSPSSSGYMDVTTVTSSASIALSAAPDIVLDLQRILG